MQYKQHGSKLAINKFEMGIDNWIKKKYLQTYGSAMARIIIKYFEHLRFVISLPPINGAFSNG